MSQIQFDKKVLLIILLTVATIFLSLIAYRLGLSKLMSNYRVFAQQSSNDFYGSINAEFIKKIKLFAEKRGKKIKSYRFSAVRNLLSNKKCEASVLLDNSSIGSSEEFYYFGAKLNANSDKECFDNNPYYCSLDVIYDDGQNDWISNNECYRKKWISYNLDLSSQRSWCDKNKGEWCWGFWVSANTFSNCRKISDGYEHLNNYLSRIYYEDDDSSLLLKNSKKLYQDSYGYGYEDSVCCAEPCSLSLHLCPGKNETTTLGDCNKSCKNECEECEIASLINDEDDGFARIKVDAIKYYCPDK